MKIKRTAIQALIEWKNKPHRKPLVLQGARQVGKTWVLKEFGRTQFEGLALFNFDENPELKEFFTSTKDVKRILQNLSLVYGKKIEPQKTLIIFDEIQECNDALNALKYFCEEAPEYCIACAGSLLGVAMSRGASFPVGKVDFMQIHPVTFLEFLDAAEPELAAYLHSISAIEPLPEIFFNRLLERFKMYYISGGMPEAISVLLGEGDIARVQEVLQAILNAYTLDFSKHAENKDIPKIGYIWNSLPSQLARENNKFLYQTVRPGARARDYENALLWLANAGLVYRVYRSMKPALPISTYDDLSAFKVYSLDVGLLRRQAGLAPSAIAEGNRLLTEFKGSLTENYILESLVNQLEGTPRYWTSGNTAEVDFLIQVDNEIIPVEVKADENIAGRSLSVYRKSYSPKLALRYSLRNFKRDGDLINIPLFMADLTGKILGWI